MWAAFAVALSFGCYEDTEDNLDGGPIDMAAPCEDGAVQSCVVEEGCLGAQVCTGGSFGPCERVDEICDGVDNDCDGEADESFGVGEACEAGQGKCTDQGRTVCAEDGQSTVCDAQPGDGTDEVCDGVDNDCNGEIDDGVDVGIECDTGLPGVCSVGETTCEAGDTACVATTEASDEICDGLDNDCDGAIDEGEVGGPLAAPCYDGPEGTEGVGACVGGVQVCADGEFGECVDQVVPGEEICDGADNDCNGEIDDAEAECVCAAGETQPCYSGPEGTEGVGACIGGTQTCLEDGSGFGACESEVVPGVELCDGLDNDCNGDIDDAPNVGGPCVSGAGACEGGGQFVCDMATGQVVCDAEPGLPGDEICDGVDNDCDGMVDDVEGAGEPCAVGEGACLARGVQRCAGGALACDAVEGAPGEEICDGVDNDCDGAIDDVEGVGEACEVGIGACRSTGVTVCSPEGVTCGATAQPAERAEFCGNRADDDCDGETDEPDCIIPCDVDEDCDFDNICEEGACVPGNCRVDDDCGVDALCEENFCVPGNCRVDEDCLDGEICDLGFCAVFPDVCLEPPTIEAFGVTEGSTEGAPSQVTASCGSGARSSENAYELALGYEGTVCVDTFDSAYDTVLYARSDCARQGSEIICSDDAGPTGFRQSQIELEVTPDGTYYVFVDGFGANSSGDYVLTVREGPCGACTGDRDCPGDELCAPVDDQGGVCVPAGCGDGIRGDGEECDDGRNDDGDGCSARCEIEEGFDCVEAPADIAPVAVDIDGQVNCGPTPANASPIDVPAWPAYRLYYVGGFVQISADGRKTFGISIAVDGEVAATTPFLGVRQDPAEVAELYAGFSSDLFGVPDGAAVGAFFRDDPCGDNGGVLNGAVRAVDYCFPTTCLADEDCVFDRVCVDGECVEPLDSDGDGVADLRDVDDDNDGIPDALECFEAGEAQTSVLNGGFEAPPLPAGTNRQTPEGDVPGWETTEGPGSIEMWGSGFLGVPAAVGNAFAEVNAFEADGALYQDVATVPGTVFTWSFYHRGRGGPDELELRAGPPDAPVAIATAVTDNDAWRRYTGTYTVPDGQMVTRFEFRSILAVAGPGAGNFIDGVEFLPACPPDADADGDGIPNSLDLDSDGDGIPDAEEAGHGLPHTDGRVDGDVGGNGLVDDAETVPDSGIIDYVLRDRDGNGVYDFLEDGPYDCGNGLLDEGEECDDNNRADGDGCSIECQVEPDWMCVFNEADAVGPCAEGQPVDTVEVTPGANLPAIGGNGGNGFTDTCPPGEVVIGFDLSIGQWPGFPGPDFITQSQAQCATLDVVDGAVVLAPTILTPIRGNTGNPTTVTRCPDDHVVTGYVGYDAGNAQRYVAGLALVCSPVAVADGAVEVGEPIVIDAVGNTSNEVGRFDCAENQLVGANVGRSGDIIDRFTMRCDDIVQACRIPQGSVCEYQGECLVDADCEDGQLCRGNVCVDAGACPDDDGFEPNDDAESATAVMDGRYEDLAVCGDDDWYTMEVCAGGTLTIDLYFVDDDGDIDIEVQGGPAGRTGSDDERVVFVNGDAPADVTWRVFGFDGDQNGYAMDVTVTDCIEVCPDGRFPAECPEGFVATDDRTCELQAQEPAVANGEFLQVCRGPVVGTYGQNGVLLPGGTVIGGGFFGDGADGSRLNTAGVWACGPDGQTAMQPPINEAIGFATCFQLDEPGEYVVGLGGDDNIVASLDGQEIFRQNVAYQSWYLVPTVLSGGTHIITLEGVNGGGAGGFAAEIYGPFPPGSTADDATMAGLDYGDNVVFTSLDQVGGEFNTGTNSGYSCPEGLALDLCGAEPQCTRFERLDRCQLAAVFCGNGEVEADEGEECDDGNFEDGDGCSSDCQVEGDFVCREEGFGIGVTDSVPEGELPDWSVSDDGLTVIQNANSRPATYSTSLPISPNYRAVFNVSVQTEGDDDMVGWTIGAGETPLSAPDQPYLLFSWKQLDQDAPDVGLATAGLRVGLVDGPVTNVDLWQFNGPITRLADGNNFGAVGWEDRRVYTVEVTGDETGLQVYVDGELEFDLEGPLPAGNLGFYTYSQNQYTAELVAPLTLQVCEEVVEICDNDEDDDEDGAVDCDDRDCNLDPACAVTRTVYFSAPASVVPNTMPGTPTRLYTVDGEGALQLLGDILLDGEPIRVSALAVSPDGQLWGFEFVPADPLDLEAGGVSRLLLIDPDTATAMVMDAGAPTYIDGAAFDPDGNLWVMDALNQQVRGYDLELGIGPSVLDYPENFLGSDIAFDADGNCYLTGVDVPFEQFDVYTCDLMAGTAESLGEPPSAGGFDNGNDSTIPAIAFAYDSVTCEQRLYAFDSLSIDELGYLDLTTDPPTMTHIASTGINYSYYQTPDMGGFPSLLNAPDCVGVVELCANGQDDNGDGAVDCDDPLCADTPACLGEQPAQGDLRLVGGEGPNEGRLEVFANGEWGTVCDDYWEGEFRPPEQGVTNGDVACRQLGYPGMADIFDAGGGVDPIWLDNVACAGDEGRLIDCPANALGADNCGHAEDVGLICLLPGECRDDGQCAADEYCDGEGLCQPACANDDDCADGQLCSDGRCIAVLDFDGDGVPDSRDLDDDNDGVPDAAECGFGAENAVVNASFEMPNNAPDGGFSSNDQGAVPGWSTTSPDGIIELIGTGYEGAPTIDGRQWAELNATQASGLYQDVATVPGTLYEWSVYHRGRQGEEPFEVTIGAPDAPDYRVEFVHGNDDWRVFSGTYVVPDGQEVTRFQVTTLIPGAAGNYIDVAQFSPTCPDDVDSDGDGIPNRLDLDSDGDGLFDADEAGHDQPTTAGVVDGEAGNNGLPDAVETLPDSGDIGYAVRDSNADGDPDFLTGSEVDCNDGADDDGDGQIDCTDEDCAGDIACLLAEDCDDGIDNDLDGFTDCADRDCDVDPLCIGGEDGELRLIDGDSPNTGRLEVFIDGGWGTVCDDSWDGDFGGAPDQATINGDVACQQLGYPGMADYFDARPGPDPTLLDNVICVGDEGRLLDCPANDVGTENCGHGEDVGLTCLLPGECRDDGQCPDGQPCVDGLCGTAEICDNGADDDGDGGIDCLDADCRDDAACDIDRTVYFSMPNQLGSPVPAAPTRLYTLDAEGNAVLLGDITVDGEPVAVSAIALSPDGILTGFVVDPDGPSSTPITIDPANAEATVDGPAVPVWIHGAGYGPDGRLWVMDRTNQQVREFADDLGPGIIDYPVPMDGADIAFDAAGDCILTGASLEPGVQRDIYRCDVEAGTIEPLGAPAPEGFEDADGDIRAVSLAFALRADTCQPELFTLDGLSIDELGTVDLSTDPPAVRQVASTGINYSWYVNPDAAGFPDIANSPACIPERETQCADGVDDDRDGEIDCADNDCIGEPSCVVEPIACAEAAEAIVGPGIYRGSTVGTGDDHTPSCRPNDSQETVHPLFASRTATWCIDTRGTAHDTVLYVRETDCPGADDTACNDDIGFPNTQSEVEFRAIHGRTYYVFVDGFAGVAGDYVLNASRGRCGEVEAACDDGLDDDDDGDIDCADSDCAGVGDCPAARVPACGDGTIDEGEGEECDDGNLDDGDGCSSACALEGGFACEQVDFGLGVEDALPTPGDDNPSEWLVSGGGFVVTQNRNSRPAHYSTTLPISPTYTAAIRVGVRTASDNDGIGWTIGASDMPLTDWQQPYLLFYWRQGTQDDDVYGLGREGLRVARVDGPSTGRELNQLDGPNVTLLAEGNVWGDERWQDNTNYLVEIVGDGALLEVYVDGVLEFSLADTGIEGNLGFFSLSQTQFRAELVSPREIQICGPAAPAEPVDVAIAGFAMNPDPVVVSAGDTVRWTNMDGATHTVTSGIRGAPDAGSTFDSGNIAPGETYEFTFDAPGIYTYFCRPHVGMDGYQVIVE